MNEPTNMTKTVNFRVTLHGYLQGVSGCHGNEHYVQDRLELEQQWEQILINSCYGNHWLLILYI